jgi:transcriptional regulator GlxA family with amidase domain
MKATRTIGYFVFDGVVLLEFAGPLQVFDVAGRVAMKRHLTDVHPFKSLVLSKTGDSVMTREGVTLGVHHSIESHEPLDMVLVPGGALQAELVDATVEQWLKKASATTEVTGSVCVGSFLLGKAGLLDGREATTHFEDTADLRATSCGWMRAALSRLEALRLELTWPCTWSPAFSARSLPRRLRASWSTHAAKWMSAVTSR